MNAEIIELKKKILEASYNSQEGHVPSSFSILDIIYCLFKGGYVLRKKKYLNNFVLSKGHGSMALYAVLLNQKKNK